MWTIVLAALSLLLAIAIWTFSLSSFHKRATTCPISVNYHFSRQCNKSCGFCFHTATTSHKETVQRAKTGLFLLRQAGMKKLNFAGGEPFLYPKFLGALVNYSKQELQLESVSIVTNGSLVTQRFLQQHGHNIDILAVSCDSFHEQTNIEIGRGSGDQISRLYEISQWCREYGIKFKLNTVVCRLNFKEDMNAHIAALQPFRWKCFQVLIVQDENDSEQTLRDVRKFLVSGEEFEDFCRCHRHQPSFVPESNQLMSQSYLILDEYMRFLDRSGLKPSPSILEVGVDQALSRIHWDEKSFIDRGGVYDWSRGEEGHVGCETETNIDW